VRALTLAVACAVALSSSGCMVVSLHPANDDATILYDDGLIGRWKSDDEETTVQVAAGEWRSYRVTLATPRYTTTLSAHLTRIGGEDLLDLMPATGVDLTTLSIAVHVVVRLKRDGDVLSVSAMDYESARRAIPKPFGLPAVMDERQNVVITAGTAELRRELARDAPGTSIFGPGSTLRRVQAG
jgi:hypothetical protein